MLLLIITANCSCKQEHQQYQLCISSAPRQCTCGTSCLCVCLQEAVAYYKLGLKLPEARFHVGRCYDHGIGTVQDNSLALKWYKQARQQL